MRFHHAIEIPELTAALEHLCEAREIDRVAVTERPRLLRDPVPTRFERRMTESNCDVVTVITDLHDQHVVCKRLAHGGKMLDALGTRAGQVGDQQTLRRQRRPRLKVKLTVIDRRRKAVPVERIEHDHIVLRRATLDVTRRIVVNDAETVVILRNEELLAKADHVGVDFDDVDPALRQLRVAVLGERAAAETEHQDASCLPLEEQEELQTQLQKEDGTILIQLVSPVSKDRVPKILKNARGFVYCVSSMGVTGQEATFHRQILEYLTAVKKEAKIPVMMGFGIRTAEDVRPMKEIIDGAIVGSHFITLMRKHDFDPQAAADYCSTFKKELNEM